MKRYEEYKDSEIAGIIQIPVSWSSVKLKFVASCNDDVLADSTEDGEIISYVEIGDVDYVNGITNATEYEFGEAPSRARRITRPDDIIVSTVRTYLKAIAKIPTTNLIVSTGFAVIRPQYINKNFMCYALLAPPFIEEVMSRSVGVSYPAIKASLLMDIKICVPQLQEQQSIASFLDAKTKPIDNIISKREKQIELLEEMKSAIISHAVTKGLNPDAKMKDSGIEWIGEIPESWEIGKLKYGLKGMQDGTHGSYTSIESEYPLLSAKNVTEKGITVSDGERYISKNDYDSIISNGYPQKNDIVLCCVGTIGRCCIYKLDHSIAFQRSVTFLRTNSILNTEYLLFSLRSTVFLPQYELYSKTTAQSGIYMGALANMITILPPREEQGQIASYLDSETSKLDTRIAKRRRQIELLQEYKQALITDAVTGKIDVRGFNS